MKKRFFLFLIPVLTIFSFADVPQESVETAPASTVYVCGESKIYHKVKTHNALGRCKSGISTMSEDKAKSLGKRVCRCRY